MADYVITVKNKSRIHAQGNSPRDAFAKAYPNVGIVSVTNANFANVCIELVGGTRKTKNLYQTVPVKNKPKAKGKLYATGIMWDVDFDEDGVNLPTEVEIPAEIAEDPDYQGEKNRDMLEEHIADWLSDTFDFCHQGFRLVRK